MENSLVTKNPLADKTFSRRDFLKFMGLGAAQIAAAGVLAKLAAWDSFSAAPASTLPFAPLSPTRADALTLADGFRWNTLIGWGDSLGGGLNFGYNNDFIACIPIGGRRDDAVMMVNHEYAQPLFVSGHDGWTGDGKTAAQVAREKDAVGASLFRVRKQNGRWTPVPGDAHNARLTARTPIPFVSPRPILGKTEALGTLANCAGGVTPWGTFLTCEENFDEFYGDIPFANRHSRKRVFSEVDYGWSRHDDNPPEHYGWVVEIDPVSHRARKLTSLGRFSHEGATVVAARDGTCAVYMGDDTVNECLYKFVSDKPGDLTRGTLYVAELVKGEWLPLDFDRQSVLQKHFTDQTEVLTYARHAARLVGATLLDRPEDIEINPRNGDVIVSLTNNATKNNWYGSLLRLREENNDPRATRFEHGTFLAGGPKTGFACPDNLAFDPKGNLWMTTDISGTKMGKEPYLPFCNNGLFYIPMSGKNAGRILQAASAPADAELTGMRFAPDGRSLFISVQHPGELSTAANLTSHWPAGGNAAPRPCVVEIGGETMERLLG